MKKLLYLFLCLLVLNCNSQTAIVNKIYTSPEADILPSFTDDPTYINDYIARNFRVSEIMKRQDDFYSGMITVHFIVDSSGNVSDVNSYDSRNVYIEEEIKRIIIAMPKWKPAVKNNEFITTKVFYPIAYQINNNIFEVNKIYLTTVNNDKKTHGIIKFAIVSACFFVYYLSFKN